jgi:hypothetical protein
MHIWILRRNRQHAFAEWWAAAEALLDTCPSIGARAFIENAIALGFDRVSEELPARLPDDAIQEFNTWANDLRHNGRLVRFAIDGETAVHAERVEANG